MKAVIQRVSSGSVSVSGENTGSIRQGLVILLGVTQDDTREDANYLAEKIINLRIFEDPGNKMNLSIRDVAGSMLVISQFTLLADCRKGRRPSFVKAARPKTANELYTYFVDRVKAGQVPVETGRFGADMAVTLVNDGPVTIVLDSKKR
ncbi:MAG: D-tyrosyl-tRNA(Tyr) deacylase [Desulfobacterales bacterium]|nr:D-tyrosyl-tRNA(Tyr) deacylase [Desulfobacterales bacterium]